MLGGVPAISAPPNGGPQAAVSLSISVVPAVLPADNSTYPGLVISLLDKGGSPTVATNDTSVYLTSSLESVGRVQSNVTIGLGKNYIIANFTTTKTPGTTKITASSAGLMSVSIDVPTLVARGYPTQLIIKAVPDTVIAKRNNIGGIIMQLQDDAGLPAKAVSATTVNLYSSNKQVLNISEPSTTIQAGQFLRLVNYTTGFVPGSAFITGSASGFSPGSTSVTVLGLPPLALKLIPEPSQMVTCVPAVVQSCVGRLVIALTDFQGNPVPAPRDITVFIRSSDLSIIRIPNDQVYIQRGSISSTGTFETTSLNGTAKITVSSPSLDSGFADIVTNAPATVETGQTQVKLYVGPTVVLANHESYSSLVASLVGGYVGPTYYADFAAVNSTGPTTVVLTSSLSAVGNITSVYLTIPAGQNFAATVFTSTFQVGTTILTASAHNLLPDQDQLATFGPVPARIVLKTTASTFPADGGTHSALEIRLEDSFGSPALAPTYLPVSLSSSENGIVRVFPTAIKAGQSFVIANVTTGVVPGTANVTAVASTSQLPLSDASKLSSGYIVSSTQLATVIPAPSVIKAYVAPEKGILDNAREPFLVVQLQDASSNPARARQVTSVTITSSNTTVFDKTLRVTLPPGADFVKVPIQARTTGSTTFTLSSPGLDSAFAVMTFLPQLYIVQIAPLAVNIFANQTISLTASAQLIGQGVKGVEVSWNASSGGLSSTNSTTGAAGTASVVFTPSGPGVQTVLAILAHPVLGTQNVTSTIIVLPVLIKEQPSILQQLLTFPYVLGIVGAAIGAIIALLFVMRRRRKGANLGEDAGFDLAVSAFPLRR